MTLEKKISHLIFLDSLKSFEEFPFSKAFQAKKFAAWETSCYISDLRSILSFFEKEPLLSKHDLFLRFLDFNTKSENKKTIPVNRKYFHFAVLF